LNIFLLITLYVLSSVIIAEVACRTVLHYGNLYSYEYLFPFVVLGALAIYKLFLQIEMRENLLSKMAPDTFGLYLVHAMILDVLNRYLTKSPMQLFNSTLSGMLIKLCIVLPLSFGIVWLLKQNRFLSKLI
jgi:surface polysaccharide O-acyltransferase-like enzyme